MDSVVNQHVWFRHENRAPAPWCENSPTIPWLWVRSIPSWPMLPRLRICDCRATSLGALWLANIQPPRPQAMPFKDYAKVCYAAYDVYQGYDVAGTEGLNHRKLPERTDLNSWQQWEQDGQPMGAYRLSAPQWYDLIAYSAWWNNVNDAIGMHHWGKRLGDPQLIDKSRRIVNLVLVCRRRRACSRHCTTSARNGGLGVCGNSLQRATTRISPARTGTGRTVTIIRPLPARRLVICWNTVGSVTAILESWNLPGAMLISLRAGFPNRGWCRRGLTRTSTLNGNGMERRGRRSRLDVC